MWQEEGKTLREWIPHLAKMGFSEHTQRLQHGLFSKETTLALVHSPPLCSFAQDLQDQSLRETPVDREGGYRNFDENITAL